MKSRLNVLPFWVLIWVMCFPPVGIAQTQKSFADTLPEVTISAFGGGKRDRAAAAVGTLKPADFAPFSPISPLPAINTIPGVRMEERSPGSYRLGIRGSALQAPFGVRNVKVYYNGIPFTDPGGTTYLNSLGIGNFGSVEIIRGAGGSLYGSGTGGVVLLQGPASASSSKGEISLNAGSFGLLNGTARLCLGNTLHPLALNIEQTQSRGYREQSSLNRTVVTGEGMIYQSLKTTIFTTVVLSNFTYQTPGALTRAEYDKDPKAARPPAGNSPGAIAASAQINQQLALGGITATYKWSPSFSGKGTLYGIAFKQENPNIRNYSRLCGPHVGGRAEGQYLYRQAASTLSVLAGIEAQQSWSHAEVYANKTSNTDTLQSKQTASYLNSLLFFQTKLERYKWTLTVGASGNVSRLALASQVFSRTLADIKETVFYYALVPRFSVLRLLGTNASVFATAGKGFNPPPLDAVAPTGSPVNTTLGAQQGGTYELGYRQALLARCIESEITLFSTALRDIVVARRDAAGGDTYVNAGNTVQRGIEAAASYNWLKRGRLNGFIKAAYTGSLFKYASFITANGNFSGRQYPGISPHTVALVSSVSQKEKWSFSASYYYASRFWANDANTAVVDAYHLLGLNGRYSVPFRRQAVILTVGIENLLNQRYTLGADLNAFGGRFYNAAPVRNGYIGIKWQLNK